MAVWRYRPARSHRCLSFGRFRSINSLVAFGSLAALGSGIFGRSFENLQRPSRLSRIAGTPKQMTRRCPHGRCERPAIWRCRADELEFCARHGTLHVSKPKSIGGLLLGQKSTWIHVNPDPICECGQLATSYCKTEMRMLDSSTWLYFCDSHAAEHGHSSAHHCRAIPPSMTLR